MLVDGGGLAGSERVGGYQSGPDLGEEVFSPYFWSRGLKRLDVVVLTHADHDHIDGLYSVLENFRVSQLRIGCDQDRPAFKRLIAEARSLDAPIVHVRVGSMFTWGNGTVEALWPDDSVQAADPNNESLVLHLTDGHLGFLLTGDMEKKAESRLVEEHAPIESDFLKVPHPGSKTSSTEAFLEAVAPKVAVASVGEGNPFRSGMRRRLWSSVMRAPACDSCAPTAMVRSQRRRMAVHFSYELSSIPLFSV
jgi:competence protein ComEC